MDTEVTGMYSATAAGMCTRSPGRAASVEVIGDLDLHSAPDLLVLARQIVDECRRAGARRMRIGFAGLEFCDSSGIATLVRARQYANDAGVTIELADRPEHLVHLLRLSGLEGLFAAGGVDR